MRATNNKHYGSETRRYAQPAKKAEKTVKSHKGVKIASAVCASLIACAALVIPTTTLAPNVDAYEDSRAASFSIGGLDQFSAVITNNCEQLPIRKKRQSLRRSPHLPLHLPSHLQRAQVQSSQPRLRATRQVIPMIPTLR